VQDENGRTKTKINGDRQERPSYTTRVKNNVNVKKAGGQECPPHTNKTNINVNGDGQQCPSYTFAYTKTSPGRAVRVRLARVF
jgi:hypothetical protein